MNNLRKVSKRILGFLRIKIVYVLNAIFDSIRDHVLLEHVVNEVGLEGQVICDLQETLTNITWNGRFGKTLYQGNLFVFTILDKGSQKLFIIYIML
jgi:hypothetical protein